MSNSNPNVNEVANAVSINQLKVGLKVEQVSTRSRFNLPAFSFLLCFVLLMANCWAEIDGAGSFFLSVGCAALISLFGWVLVAILLKFAFVLPIRAATHFNPVAAACYLATFGLLQWYWFEAGDSVLGILCTMAIAAVLAIPCCLLLVIPARILARFLADLFAKKTQ